MSLNNEVQRFSPTLATGLTEQEVLLRQNQGLVNETQEKITKTNGQIIRDNVCTLFNFFNFIIGVCLALVSAYANMVYLLIVCMNIFIGIVQEIHAKKMVENLSLIGAAKAIVVRDGKEEEIPVENLVLDDIVILKMGSQICTDSMVLEGTIEVNESMLTGEADPVLKQKGDTLLSGSFVISGNCYTKVEHVGEDNFAAKLAKGARKQKGTKSELLSSMGKVTKATSYVIIPMGILLFLEAYFLRSNSIQNSVISTSASLLGMLPKGLVLLISTSLVVGIIKLSKQKVLVQDLYALEMLAHVDMLCLDKTGTITEGKMRVSNLYIVDETPLPITAHQVLCSFVDAMEDNNATFMALKEYFQAKNTYNVLHKVPFSSERKWSAVTFENMGTVIVGAPEKLLCNDMNNLPTEAMDAQKLGKRILCLGYTTEPIIDGILPKMHIIAAIELSDPIRKNAKETLAFFKEEGVEIKVISGDNPITVSSIAKQAGLEEYASYIDMSTVKSEEEISSIAKNYSVFGRVTPIQKSQLVKALQAENHTVAMTGDGVNDVLALREADCSIAMAAGSDAARQVSKMVLLDSDFTAIPNMVMEGRRVVNNITRFGGVFLVKTIYSILLSIFCVLSMTAFPFAPVLITLYDAVIEGFPSFLLSFEPSRKKVERNFLKTTIRTALPFALLIVLNIIAIPYIQPLLGISKEEAVTVMYFVTSFIGLMAVFNACRPFNILRGFVCITASVGFYVAAYLFADILKIELLFGNALIFFVILVCLCVPLVLFLIAIVNKCFLSKRNQRIAQ